MAGTVGSEDSHGRALWALGTVLGQSQDAGLRGAAGRLFEAAVPSAWRSRARAHGHSACSECRHIWEGSPATGPFKAPAIRWPIACWIFTTVARTSTWQWFEKSLSYSNARLPQALILAGRRSDNKRMVAVGIESLEWLVTAQHRGDPEMFVPVGSSGLYREGGERPRFDQQPVEACATISACLEAYRFTHDEQWRAEAGRVFGWFLGKNDLRVPLYDATTGGCRDGLHPDRVNENQGAESTLSFLMSQLEMQASPEINAEATYREMSASCQSDYRPGSSFNGSLNLETTGQKACSEEPLFTRHGQNPILSREHWPYPINSVFNAGVVRLADGDTLLLCRVEDRRGLSHLCAARSAKWDRRMAYRPGTYAGWESP